MVESTQHKLDRVRSPRVQLTYDVEIGDAIQRKEIPFVLGILADLSGKSIDSLPLLKDRKFVEIDRDNFDDIMASITPKLSFSVENKLTDGEPLLGVELLFKCMDDFNPVNIVKQIAPLAKLFEARVRLNDLLAKLDGNDDLERLLKDIITNAGSRDTVKQRLDAVTSPAGAAS